MANVVGPGGVGGFTGDTGTTGRRTPVVKPPPDVAETTPNRSVAANPPAPPSPYAVINGSIFQYDPRTGKYDIPYQATQTSGNTGQPTVNLGGGGSGSGAMTAYESAQVALDKQRLADAEAQRQADEQYRQSQALETANKDFQDYQTKHPYGSVNGMAYAPPAGAATFYKLQEPPDVQAALANKSINTTGQVDPWSQGPTYSGFSGTNFSNPQQPGNVQNQAIPQGATPTPAPGQTPPTPIPKSMAAGGKVPGPPGQPQLELLHGGEQVVPGGNFDDSNPQNPPSPVANQGPDQMNPLIKALLAAVNGIITSPDFQNAVYSGSGKPGEDMGQDMDQMTPPGMATGGTVAQDTLGVLHGGEDVVQTPSMPPTPVAAQSSPNPWNSADVVSGPIAPNHIPYGPELTGASGFGGLITPNGTPVPMSMWQRQQLDPTAIANYNDYLSSVAGVNPQDFQQIGTLETGNKMSDLKAPTRFNIPIPIGAPSGG